MRKKKEKEIEIKNKNFPEFDKLFLDDVKDKKTDIEIDTKIENSVVDSKETKKTDKKLTKKSSGKKKKQKEFSSYELSTLKGVSIGHLDEYNNFIEDDEDDYINLDWSIEDEDEMFDRATYGDDEELLSYLKEEREKDKEENKKNEDKINYLMDNWQEVFSDLKSNPMFYFIPCYIPMTHGDEEEIRKIIKSF